MKLGGGRPSVDFVEVENAIIINETMKMALRACLDFFSVIHEKMSHCWRSLSVMTGIFQVVINLKKTIERISSKRVFQ